MKALPTMVMAAMVTGCVAEDNPNRRATLGGDRCIVRGGHRPPGQPRIGKVGGRPGPVRLPAAPSSVTTWTTSNASSKRH